MPTNKFIYVSKLLNKTIQDISKNKDTWKHYLDTSARLYKYKFHEQILIYAQRSDAVACADIQFWNKNMKCLVKKGAKGIALIDDESIKPGLRYVFDIADIQKMKYIGKDPYIWGFPFQHMGKISELIANKYNLEGKDFIETIRDIAEAAARNYYEKNKQEIHEIKTETLMEELDLIDIGVRYKETLAESIIYTVLSRCGLKETDINLDFRYIYEFNSVKAISKLGTATTEICKIILKDIAKIVRKEYVADKNALADNPQIEYNALKRKSNNEYYIDLKREGSNFDEHNISKKWRLSNSRFKDGRRGYRGSEEVWTDEEVLPKEQQGSFILGDGYYRGTVETPTRHSRSSREEGRNNNKPTKGKRTSYRTIKGSRPNDLGAKNEQYTEVSRGNNSDGVNLYLEKNEQLSLFPSLLEQMGNIAVEYANQNFATPTAFSLPEDWIEKILVTGSGKNNSRLRIFAKYQKNLSPKEMVDFLKGEYQLGGKGFEFDGKPISTWYDFDGIKVSHGNAARYSFTQILTWEEVEQKIRGLIKTGRYLDEYEIKQVPLNEKKELASKIYFFFRDEYAEVPESFGFNNFSYPDSEKKLIEMLGDENKIKQIIKELDYAIKELDNGNKKRKIKLIYPPEEILKDVKEQLITNINYPARLNIEVMKESFITFDEIDYHLCKGSNFSQGSFRIYDYFSELHTLKEKADFLKKEYGTGGMTHALPGSDKSYQSHDYKGLRLEKGSIANPYASIVIKWEKVVKRIEHLIAKGLYLSPANIEKYNAWKYGEKVEDSKTTHLEEEFNLNKNEESENSFSPKQKFKVNISAIKLLKLIEREERHATNDERKVLAQYIGWGGIPEAFDERNESWKNEYLQLKEILNESEYDEARSTVLNAHYTPIEIINEMYTVVGRVGFKQGKVLEPALGTGKFFGVMPDEMKKSQLYGVEIDGVTSRIAKQLYPNANIQGVGFEKTNFNDNYFDLAIGNVPFGQYKVYDGTYNKHNFLIHDYFIAKSLDKVRPGGLAVFITTKGTMDKANNQARKYMAQRAELMGAVRLPNNAFKSTAGTNVTSDILFFKKRDQLVCDEPDWIFTNEINDGIRINQYFVDNPEMIIGKMEMTSGPYGMEPTCNPIKDTPFKEQLQQAMKLIEGKYESRKINDEIYENERADIIDEILPADSSVKNYSYTIINDKVYYRENESMHLVVIPKKTEERVKGLIKIRNCTNELITLQLEEIKNDTIVQKQIELNSIYDDYTYKHGIINSTANKRAFSQDSSYCLLCSLEKLNDDGTFKAKADMFTKRTIKMQSEILSVDTPSEALLVSISEKACVDLGYMKALLGNKWSCKDIINELQGVIFKNPLEGIEDIYRGWQTADEYLSGNVREKLEIAQRYSNNKQFEINISELKKVQPKMLDASEIEIKLGATWLEPKYINDFMTEVFETPKLYLKEDMVNVRYIEITGEWNIKGKSVDSGNVLTNVTYGTQRVNAYRILEDSLNLRDTRVFDTVVEDGNEKRVLNKKETLLAAQKQDSIKAIFKEWIFKDVKRRNDICEKYNKIFNSIRPREYDGSHLSFPGMTPEITLNKHQKNAVAHILYGDNVLLAHVVGAGKTFTMIAAAMELKRLNLAQKPLFVVPNHLTEQWASDFLKLYPGANILASTKKDFEPSNRKKFCSRIATGEYDAVIIGHSQFEKIPLSQERQTDMIKTQIKEVEVAIKSLKEANGERYTVKQMEKTKMNLQLRLEKLNNSNRKDDVVTFEQCGVDRLFVDESHNFKNLFLYTKMRNVAGISQTEAQKSSDLFAKCQYIDEITGDKGITFATGTPISNSMTELYTNMRYLQHSVLRRLGLLHFDSWAANFGETVTAIELAPEGTGYRTKTRFARFFNLPELMNIFKECADIQTADMLNLPVPEVKYHNIVLKPSEYQKEMVKGLAERAEQVRNRLVEPNVDNMLKITNDGRKLALDQRLINEMLPDEVNSKKNACVQNVFDIWSNSADKKSTQLIFCDLSTPKNDGKFNIYDDIRNKLIEKGIDKQEISFIHEANTDKKKAELFAKVRSGQVRVLIGSTSKMGAGTNVQDRLIALHHLDVPWRPSDIEQQEGRILRQGNQNSKVDIYRFVTEGTFDSYSWQLIENKQKFISQIMTSKSPVRSCEDIDDATLTYAEVKALATGNPHIKEKMDLDIQVARLKLLKSNHMSQKYRMEDNIAKQYPQKIKFLEQVINGLKKDIQTYELKKPKNKEEFIIKIDNRNITEKKDAGNILIEKLNKLILTEEEKLGEYLGFAIVGKFDVGSDKYQLQLKGELTHKVEMGVDTIGNITRINNALEGMSAELLKHEENLCNALKQLENAKQEVIKEFPQQQELEEKLQRLNQLNSLLNTDEKEDIVSIKGLNKYSCEEVENLVIEHVLEILNENSYEDIQIIGAAVYGSRIFGNPGEDSDLDVVVEYQGNIREDELFNLLHGEEFEIEDITIDINPITAEKTGTISDFIAKAKNYIKENQGNEVLFSESKKNELINRLKKNEKHLERKFFYS